MQRLKRYDLKGEKRKGLGRGGSELESGTGRRSWDIIMTGSQDVTLGGAMMMVGCTYGSLLYSVKTYQQERQGRKGSADG